MNNFAEGRITRYLLRFLFSLVVNTCSSVATVISLTPNRYSIICSMSGMNSFFCMALDDFIAKVGVLTATKAFMLVG